MDPSKVPGNHAAGRSPINAGTPDILLVEDSPTTAELFMFALKANKSGATVRIVRDGVEALEALLGGDSHVPVRLPRLLLLDLHMPRLDGLEVLARLRADDRTRALPVVVYSASELESDRREALRRGANAYVQKPVGFTQACAAVGRIERDWLGTGRLDAALDGRAERNLGD
jgi:CheY-like chemotaxis protein